MAEEKRKITFGFAVFIAVVELVFLSAVLVGAWFMDKTLLAPPLIVAFRLTRVKIEEKYAVLHCLTVSACILCSTLICWFGLYLSLPMSVSLVSNIIVGLIFAIITWKIQEVIDMKAEYEKLSSDPKANIIRRCKELGYNELKTELAVKFFVENEKPKDVWLWLLETKKYNIEWDSVSKIKKRMKKELFS
jgi:uncharacterized protein YxeA